MLPWSFPGPGHMAGCGCEDTNPGEPAIRRAHAWAMAVAQGMAHQPHARTLVVLGHQALQPSTAWRCPLGLCPGFI